MMKLLLSSDGGSRGLRGGGRETGWRGAGRGARRRGAGRRVRRDGARAGAARTGAAAPTSAAAARLAAARPRQRVSAAPEARWPATAPLRAPRAAPRRAGPHPTRARAAGAQHAARNVASSRWRAARVIMAARPLLRAGPPGTCGAPGQEEESGGHPGSRRPRAHPDGCACEAAPGLRAAAPLARSVLRLVPRLFAPRESRAVQYAGAGFAPRFPCTPHGPSRSWHAAMLPKMLHTSGTAPRAGPGAAACARGDAYLGRRAPPRRVEPRSRLRRVTRLTGGSKHSNWTRPGPPASGVDRVVSAELCVPNSLMDDAIGVY
jgi:hypothetical protein